MTHQIIPFNFQGSDVRVIDSDGEPWFVAVDVAEALGYSKPFNAVSRHCKAATTTPKQGGGTMTIIPERDVYRLVMRSKMQAAERFEEWVVGEVLPSIRKTGSYQHQAVSPASISHLETARMLVAALEIQEQQAAQLAIAAPKVEFVDRYVENTGTLTFRQVAKLLKANERVLRQLLINGHVMYRLNGVMTPYQNHIDAGRFEVKTGTSERNNHAFAQARFTPKGVQWIAGLWASHTMQEAA
jgi:prophage antirepressor-like protein